MVCSATLRRDTTWVAPEDVLVNNGSAPRGYFPGSLYSPRQ